MILDFDGDLNEAYRRVGLEGGSEAEIEAKKAGYEAVVRRIVRRRIANSVIGMADSL